MSTMTPEAVYEHALHHAEGIIRRAPPTVPGWVEPHDLAAEVVEDYLRRGGGPIFVKWRVVEAARRLLWSRKRPRQPEEVGLPEWGVADRRQNPEAEVIAAEQAERWEELYSPLALCQAHERFRRGW